MNIAAKLQQDRDIAELKEKLRVVNQNLSYYEGEIHRNKIAIEAYELLRVEVQAELDSLGEMTHPLS